MPHVTSRTIAVVDRQLCDACGLCMPLCPPMAIHMRREGLIVDPITCTSCRKCIAPCPVGALSMVDAESVLRITNASGPLATAVVTA